MNNNCLDYFGDRLKTLRRECGITQQELADAIGISKGGLCYYENTNCAPDITVLEKFADYFKVSADYLLGRTNAQTQKAKLQAVCNYTGLSDKAVNLLSDLKENSPAQLRVINFLLEQAAGDMDIVYIRLMIHTTSLIKGFRRIWRDRKPSSFIRLRLPLKNQTDYMRNAL